VVAIGITMVATPIVEVVSTPHLVGARARSSYSSISRGLASVSPLGSPLEVPLLSVFFLICALSLRLAVLKVTPRTTTSLVALLLNGLLLLLLLLLELLLRRLTVVLVPGIVGFCLLLLRLDLLSNSSTVS